MKEKIKEILWIIYCLMFDLGLPFCLLLGVMDDLYLLDKHPVAFVAGVFLFTFPMQIKVGIYGKNFLRG